MGSDPLRRVCELLARCGQSDSILPATELYNEGWMLRLVLDWVASHRESIGLLKFDQGSTWCSEALLGSRFKPRKRGDRFGEGFTRADGVIGHFRLRPGGRGDIELLTGATQLTVVEAKMASGLSAGTKHAPTFNQAARNVACVAHLLTNSGVDPSTVTNCGFVLLAPAARIAEGAFAALDKPSIAQTVRDRARCFDSDAEQWCDHSFRPILERCTVTAVSWEDMLAEITVVDPPAGDSLRGFYSQCLRYNPLLVSRRTA